MPLPIALLAAAPAAKLLGRFKKIFGGRKRRRRRRAAAAAAAAAATDGGFAAPPVNQQSRLMSSVPSTRTAVGRGLSFLTKSMAERFLGIGSKKKREEAVIKAQTPMELIKKYWWILAVVFGYLFLRKNKLI